MIEHILHLSFMTINSSDRGMRTTSNKFLKNNIFQKIEIFKLTLTAFNPLTDIFAFRLKFSAEV